MQSEWPLVRLGDHANSSLGKMLDKEKNRGELYPYLGNKNVRWGNFDTHDLQEMRFEDHEHERYGIEFGDLIICEGGEPGRCSIWKEQIPKMKIQKALHRVRTGPELNNLYLHYWFLWNGKNGFLEPFFTGTTIKHLTGRALANLQIPLPPLNTQKTIAHILGTLDDKIELNRQINSTLENMAQTLFKSWFVDFDPVLDNALAAGNPIPDALAEKAAARKALGDMRKALPEDIRRLFPAAFVWTEEMGWVPEGWKIMTLKNLTTKIGSGSTPRGGQKVYQDSGTTLIRSQNVYDSKFTWPGLAYISEAAATQLKNAEVQSGDVLLNITGASILRTCIVNDEALPARVNQHVAIIRAKRDIPSRYLHLNLLEKSTKAYLMGLNAGASREAVTKAHIESVPTISPNSKILEYFHTLTISNDKKTHQLNNETLMLEKLRDTLLPKLLSGELRIPDAEALINETT